MSNTSVNAALRVNVSADTGAAEAAIKSLEQQVLGKEWKIKVGVAGSTQGNIKQATSSLQKLGSVQDSISKKKPVSLKVDTSPTQKELKNVEKMVRSTNPSLKKAFSGFKIPAAGNDFQGILKQWNTIKDSMNALGKPFNFKTNVEGNKLSVMFDDGIQKAQRFEYTLEKIGGKGFALMSDSMSSAVPNGIKQLDDYEKKFTKLRTALSSSGVEDKEKKGFFSEIDNQLQAVKQLKGSAYLDKSTLSSFESGYGKLVSGFNGKGIELPTADDVKNSKEVASAYSQLLRTQEQMTRYFASNKKASNFQNAFELRGQVANLMNAYNSKRSFTEDEIKQVQQLSDSFTQFKTNAIEAGVDTNTAFGKLTSKFKTLGTYMVTSLSFQYMLQGVKSIVSSVVDLDSALTELRKVSSGSAEDYKKVITDAGSIAQQTGNTVSDVVRSASDWARQGYGLADATQLAKVSALYQNVGDNIDIDTATNSLTSTIQGFDLPASQAESVVDKFNEVSNNFAISSGDIGEALQRSSASFKVANTDLSEAIALTTGTNAVVQDAARTGNMWKTVSARIRGAETELQNMGEDTDGIVTSSSKLQSLVKGMTGFDIMEKDGETFKSIYDIVVGIGDVWNSLSDIDQASLLEALAGKNQANALAAALNNVDMIKEAYKTAEFESEGSAEKENARYMESIQGRVGQLKATFQETSSNLANSDFLKGAVSGANEFLQVINEISGALGSLGTLAVFGGGGAAIAAFVKNFD